jgi:hypothetical protein
MSFRRLALGLSVVLVFAVVSATAGAAGSGPRLRSVNEFPSSGEADAGATPFGGSITDRRGRNHGDHQGEHGNSGKKSSTNPTLNLDFEGLNFFQQRYANNANQFSVEPPDQALCVGNGRVLEAVNDVIQVYDTAGHSVLPADGNTGTVPHVNGTVDLNTFYHYPAAIDRGTGVQGPFITDPVCTFDQATQRWFVVVLTLDVFPDTGEFTGKNHLDIAVSKGPSPVPLSNWTILKVPVQNDGTDGTPNHHCNPGDPPAAGDEPIHEPTNPTACIGDYPHIGADANGVYITTNEYDFFGDEFQSANIYAFSKKKLIAGDSSHALLETKNTVHGEPGFTVWPALSPPGQFQTRNGGTEYFLSSNAAEEAKCPAGCNGGPGTSKELIAWSLTNTKSLDSGSPNVQLKNKVLKVLQYAIPPKSNQKAGSVPLADCINDQTAPTIFGPGCWQLLFFSPPPPAVEGALDSNDTRMQQVWYSNGKLYGALDTALTLDKNRAAVEWFVVDGKQDDDGIKDAKVQSNGYLGLAGNNVIYPAIATTAEGRGIMAFTLVGNDYYPSAGYATIDANGVGKIHVAQAGVGPQDGFSEYPAFTSRPRWGDYGAAAVDGNSIWIASEYIAQTCTFTQYLGTKNSAGKYDGSRGSGFGRCNNTRGPLGNWSTRISKITPQAGKDDDNNDNGDNNGNNGGG